MHARLHLKVHSSLSDAFSSCNARVMVVKQRVVHAMHMDNMGINRQQDYVFISLAWMSSRMSNDFIRFRCILSIDSSTCCSSHYLSVFVSLLLYISLPPSLVLFISGLAYSRSARRPRAIGIIDKNHNVIETLSLVPPISHHRSHLIVLPTEVSSFSCPRIKPIGF